MYCNAACKKKHRHKHKKQCERRVAELHDELLFKQPPPKEDCPICFLRMPTLGSGRIYMACCGKVVCSGCILAPVRDHEGNEIAEKTCPLCRTRFPSTDEERVKMLNKRMDMMNDFQAIFCMGSSYAQGQNGLPRNMVKALALLHRAGELGSAEAYCTIGRAYVSGVGVEIDKKKAQYYFELAAMGGEAYARFNLGVYEGQAGNTERALKHFIIALESGESNTLKIIKEMYKNGDATKDEYAKALRSYQTYLGEIKSDLRDRAAAFSDQYKYYESSKC